MSKSPTTEQAVAGDSGDWRSQVAQAYRNTEVREISKVLAALEPGVSAASKLRLAMQFEDAVFKSATSLADYRKRLTKRLKKVQKSYVPTAAGPKSQQEGLLVQLQQQHGAALRYICSHADAAIAEMRAKFGADKAAQLQQHIDSVKQWARDLGVVQDNQARPALSEEHLKKLKEQLDRKVENVRQHVSKLADPDRFIVESLEKVEEELVEQSPASQLLARETCKFYSKLAKTDDFDAQQLWNESLERTLAPVPVPTRNQHNDQKMALLHLEKMRAASSVLLAYMALADKSVVPRQQQSLPKAHAVATEGVDFVTSVVKTLRQQEEQNKDGASDSVKLEDAWMKSLQLAAPSAAPSAEDPSLAAATTDSSTLPPDRKKPRLLGQQQGQPPVLRSKVLLTPGRRPPSNLLPAFKRKRATLVRPPPAGQGSHLVLEFGQAFVMTIYFVPLLVTLRAYNKSTKQQQAEQQNNLSDLSCASWTPLHVGLTDQKLSVWGANNGSYEQLGPIVEERLRDASAQATQVLRNCFATATRDKREAADFEVEILEATALLEFLQLARTTYLPHWQDDDDDDA